MATSTIKDMKNIKSAHITFPSQSISAGALQSFTLTSDLLPSDFNKLVSIIPSNLGADSWGTQAPAIMIVDVPSNRILIRAFVSETYAPTIDILYV